MQPFTQIPAIKALEQLTTPDPLSSRISMSIPHDSPPSDPSPAGGNPQSNNAELNDPELAEPEALKTHVKAEPMDDGHKAQTTGNQQPPKRKQGVRVKKEQKAAKKVKAELPTIKADSSETKSIEDEELGKSIINMRDEQALIWPKIATEVEAMGYPLLTAKVLNRLYEAAKARSVTWSEAEVNLLSKIIAEVDKEWERLTKWEKVSAKLEEQGLKKPPQACRMEAKAQKISHSPKKAGGRPTNASKMLAAKKVDQSTSNDGK
ncbi:hypothetical protein DFH27DRAFT_576413 [Peziza echinospora]|nr:hypothetical protein DFH27DRAFT_576413 [Peziza echinospora]